MAAWTRLGYAFVSLVQEMVLAKVEPTNDVVTGYIQKSSIAGDYEQLDKTRSISMVYYHKKTQESCHRFAVRST